MSDLNEDLSESMAAVLTGSVGVPDAVDSGDELPESMANAVEEFDQHAAEKDISVPSDVDDTRQGEADRAEEVEQQRGRGKKVPLAALQEERTRRQALEVQLAAYQQQMQQFQAQQQAAQQQQAQQAAEQAAIPDFDEDPRGYIEAKERQFAQALEQLQNGPAQQQQAAVQHQQVTAAVVNLEQQFMAAVPDYEQAVELVQRNVDAQLRQLYPQATEQQLLETRAGALSEFARQCLASGANPAERIYAKAQALGHRSAPRREAPTSLSNLGGAPRAPDEKGSVSVSQVSEMSEAEFDSFWKEMSRGGSQGPAF